MSLRRVTVELGLRSYDVHLGDGALDQLGGVVASLGLRRATVVTDTRVGDLYGARALASLKTTGLDAALHAFALTEATKTLASAERICDALLDGGHRRSDAVVALGGGVIGDVAGFAASMLLRGVPLVQVPTTVLAQADASIGGKVGVDTRHGKNLLGAFWQPRAVVSDTALLATLDARERWSGLAEIVKCALLGGGALLDLCERSLEAMADGSDPAALGDAIGLAAAYKARVVSGDEREAEVRASPPTGGGRSAGAPGSRAFLNFGHTLGHALETAGEYVRYRHGEAVALGMRGAVALSTNLSVIEKVRCFEVIGRLAVAPGPRVERARALAALAHDKKRGAILRFVVLDAIGKPALREVKAADAEAALDALLEHA